LSVCHKNDTVWKLYIYTVYEIMTLNVTHMYRYAKLVIDG